MEQKLNFDTEKKEQEFKIPTEIVELPSKGLLYPKDNPLSKGTVEMKYMTAKEEDILTNESYIKQGIVLDKLFEELIVSDIKYSDLLIVDRNAIMVAARVLSYGEDYKINVETPSGNKAEYTINLAELDNKQIDESLITPHQNSFDFETSLGDKFTFKLLTIADEKKIEQTISAIKKKLKKTTNLTSRLRFMITSVNGDTNPGTIKKFIETRFLSKDTRKFRKYVNEIQPNVDFSTELIDEETGNSFRIEIPIGLDFFWPDAD